MYFSGMKWNLFVRVTLLLGITFHHPSVDLFHSVLGRGNYDDGVGRYVLLVKMGFDLILDHLKKSCYI